MRNILLKLKMAKDSFSVRFLPLSKQNIHFVSKHHYEEVVKTLNSLQTNAALLQEYMNGGQRSHAEQTKKMEETLKYLSRCGVTLEQLDDLSVIHVSGTKGKGSTCAFCESILREQGFKTGFYSSPHLVSVRERIRINGQPLSRQEFVKHFWSVYNKLDKRKENKLDMPSYFKFLTVMAFNVFLVEKVDVAIIEVGIGGAYDCTNILRKVQAVGITSLGLDHTYLLGDRIQDIAWQKAGIMKPGSIAFTVQQSKEALEVLKTRSFERQCPLLMVPPLEAYIWDKNVAELQLSSSVQALNASLALQLVNAWLLRRLEPTHMPKLDASNGFVSIPMASGFPVGLNMMQGLKSCSWPGRTQVIQKERVIYFLDGAHTAESMEMCVSWFQHLSSSINGCEAPVRVLLFNATGSRDPTLLLTPLLRCCFDIAIFCPNRVTATVDPTSDQANFIVSLKQQELKCESNEEAWLRMQQKSPECHHSIALHSVKTNPQTKLFTCVSEALTYIETQLADDKTLVQVLVTGTFILSCKQFFLILSILIRDTIYNLFYATPTQIGLMVTMG
ncbi:folylpolyglutamate synthase, mitochondrial isoform X2 [Anabrus simplex]|uniref:folylpolyglutamate synthase, mitochondrial isoform X2 n=1 Tax=Anabrus simplex TaxID=316456 RepID=UPI0035A3BF78